ncbi:MAG: glycosyltransferase [Bacteroidales bacterium]|nr:glycosyltransferase [Bacteroidales bacterium]
MLNQTYTNIEVNISDDASDDETLNIIESINDTRIVLKKNASRLGLEGNWNSALSMAKGEYIKMLPADDIIDKTCIDKQVAIFEDNEKSQDFALVVCNSSIISPIGEQVLKRQSRLKTGENNSEKVMKKCLLWGTNVIGEPNVGLFRASLASDLHYDCSNPYMLDLDFWAKLLKKGTLYVQSEQLASFRISSKQLTAKIGFSQACLFDEFIKKISQDPYWKIPFLLRMWSKIASRIMLLVRLLVHKKIT